MRDGNLSCHDLRLRAQVLGQQLAERFGLHPFGDRREAPDVGEEDRELAPLAAEPEPLRALREALDDLGVEVVLEGATDELALPRLGQILLDLLRREDDVIVGDNEPYTVSDDTDYTIVVHGEQRGIPHVEIEVRQDLIADAPGQTLWALRLAQVLDEAAPRLIPHSKVSPVQ